MIEGPQIPKSPRTYTAQGSDVYVVKLTTGTEINSGDDLTSLYHNFVLPSWMSDRAKVKISERRHNKPFKSFRDKCFTYTTQIQLEGEEDKPDKAGKFLFVEEERKEEVIKTGAGKIEKLLGGSITYQVSTIPESSNHYRIVVKFSKSQEDKTVIIEIEDPDGFLKLLPKAKSSEETETKWLRKDNELYYPYIEPENIRTVETKDKPHLHIAFRGGGAKGAAYVGAVKALLDDNPGVEIKSIIGSSAGGIIALAMAARCETSELIEHCKKMTEIPRDTTFKDIREISQNDQIEKEIEQTKENIWRLIENFGIIPNNNKGLIYGLCRDEGFVEALLTWLGSQMEGIGEMFDIRVGGRTRRLNYYGLLIGHLLKGDKVKEIALNVINQFLGKCWPNKEENTTNRQKLRYLYPPVESTDDAETLTMEQFYALTGVEFTVTGTDITSRILRFFNHKTTPNLPVHMAVILTGSFPVAFEAQKWKSQWGKYYIHYERWRREIDLTGHQITDGGMLANFPIEYLDNESMRPMYFSHKCFKTGNEQNHTKIIGFGLDQLTDPQQKEKLGQLPEKTPWDNLSEKYLGTSFKVKYLWGGTPNPSEIKASELLDLCDKIPILSFLYQLLQTYIAAGDNLVLECFQSKICFESPYKPLGSQQNQKLSSVQILERIVKLIKKRQQNWSSTDFKEGKQLLRRVLIDNLNVHRKEHTSQTGKLSQKDEKKKKVEEQEQCKEIRRLDAIICVDSIIKCSQPTKSINDLLDMYITTISKRPKSSPEILEKIQSKESPQLNDSEFELREPLTRQYTFLKRSKSSPEILEKIQSKESPDYLAEFELREPQIRQYIMNQLYSAKSSNLHLVFQSASKNSLFSYEVFKLVEDCIFGSRRQIEQKVQQVVDFILSTVKVPSGKSNDDSIVIKQCVKNGLISQLMNKFDEGTKIIRLEELNYNVQITNPEEVFARLEQIKNGKRQVQRKISAVTCGSTHSALGFLLATGYGPAQVQKELKRIEKYFQLDMNIIKESLQQVKSNEWGLPDRFKINKQFQETIWKGKMDFFKEVEVAVQKVSGTSKSDIEKKAALQEEIEILKEKFDKSKESVVNSFDSVLEHLLVSVEDCEVEGFTEQLSKEMGLKTTKKDYGKINASDSERSNEVISLILESFREEVRFLLYLFANQTEIDFIRSQSPETQKEMWKCMIITRFLAADKLKSRVQQILKDLSLPVNIGLRDFYKMAPRTIELTFPAVDISNKKMRFINQKTYPKMPVWAAVVIGSSLPMLFPLVHVKSSWGTDVTADSNVRILQNLFGDGKILRSTNFTSGNLVSTFPLDLLTNHAVQERFYKEKNDYTMLCFGDCQEGSARMEDKRRQFQHYPYLRKYPTRTQIVSMGWKYLRGMALGIKKSVRGSMMMTYMESHDNLVIELYKSKLLELPVRLTTLGFDKLKPEEGNRYPAFADLLNETYFATKEKFQQTFSRDAVTYIRAQVDKEGTLAPEQQKSLISRFGSGLWGLLFAPSDPKRKHVYENVIAIEFISKERQCKDLVRKYRIEYKLGDNDKHWRPAENQKITFKAPQEKVTLRFTYPTKRNSEEGQEVFTSAHSQFVLKVDKLLGLLQMKHPPKPIFALSYKNILVKNSKIKKPQCFSTALDLSEQQGQILLDGKSIVNLQKTGLYCTVCCNVLKPIIHTKITPLENCDNKNHSRGLFFECPDNHHRYCLECCANFAVIRKGSSLYCEQNHLYHLSDWILQSGKRCDVCHQFVQVSYQDIKCNRDICRKCCKKFTLGVYSVPVRR